MVCSVWGGSKGVFCGKWAQKVLPTLGRRMQLKTGNRQQALDNFRALKHVSSGSFKSSLRILRVASVCSYAAIMSTERQSNIDREGGEWGEIEIEKGRLAYVFRIWQHY